MNCSQGTVREALMRLQHDGLVTRRGYRGTIVSDTSADEAALLGSGAHPHRSQRRRARRPLGNASGFRRARRHHRADAGARGGRRHLWPERLDHGFHAVILRAAALEAVEPILTRCMLHIHRHTVGNPVRRGPSHYENASEAHEILLKALRSGSADRSREAMRNHIEDVIKRWSPAVWAILPAGA